MIEERSIYQNVDTLNTFPWGIGFGFWTSKSEKSDFFS